MSDARFDRHAGDATNDERAHAWLPTRADEPETSWLLHWVDEKGAVVRLLTSTEPDVDRHDD